MSTHKYCRYHIMNLILDNIYGFLYIRWEFHWIFVIYRLYGNHSNVEWYLCLVDNLYHKLYNWGRKMFLVLMTRRGNIFCHRWCNAMIVWFVLPLSFFLWIWDNNRGYLILIRLISYQIIEISKCVFVWKHKNKILDMASR